IREVNLLDIAAGGKVLHALDHLHNAGAALAYATAVVDVVEPFVRVDARIQGGLTEIGTFDATDRLAFLFKTDGGHGRAGGMGAAQLRSRPSQCLASEPSRASCVNAPRLRPASWL
ncbi:MAG: hypothetical protein RLZZ213_1498, partial [Cyanobacteriota bacterium]